LHAELESYLGMIDDLREQVVRLLLMTPDEALDWRPLAEASGAAAGHETNSLAVLAAHIAGAERYWIAEAVGGRPGTRNRDAEFQVADTTASALAERLELVGSESRQVFAELSEADLAAERRLRGRSVPVRWCILHVIDHTATHLGHMQLTLQMWQGGQAGHSPRWFERIRES